MSRTTPPIRLLGGRDGCLRPARWPGILNIQPPSERRPLRARFPMRRLSPILPLFLGAVLLFPGSARPADDDPKIGDFSASYLIGIVKTDKDVKKRRLALGLLKQLGVRAPKGVIAIIGALK